MSVTQEDFNRFHEDNPHVYDLFERFALEAARAGKFVGAKAIFERLRWYTRVETKTEEDYKLNNSHVSFYVRVFQEAHPGYGMIFATRKAIADENTPTTIGVSSKRIPKAVRPPVFDGHGQGYMHGIV